MILIPKASCWYQNNFCNPWQNLGKVGTEIQLQKSHISRTMRQLCNQIKHNDNVVLNLNRVSLLSQTWFLTTVLAAPARRTVRSRRWRRDTGRTFGTWSWTTWKTRRSLRWAWSRWRPSATSRHLKQVPIFQEKNICSPADAGGVDRSFSSHESNGEKDVWCREERKDYREKGEGKGRAGKYFASATNHPFPNLLVMALRWRRRRAGRRVAQVPRFLMSRMELIRGKLPSCQS